MTSLQPVVGSKPSHSVHVFMCDFISFNGLGIDLVEHNIGCDVIQ
jgi:hypothetical protein